MAVLKNYNLLNTIVETMIYVFSGLFLQAAAVTPFFLFSPLQ